MIGWLPRVQDFIATYRIKLTAQTARPA